MLAAFVVAAAAFTGMVSLRDQVNGLRSQNAAMQQQIDDAASQRVEIAAQAPSTKRYSCQTAILEIDHGRQIKTKNAESI